MRGRSQLSFAVITPARDEAQNLVRIAECLAAQTVRPTAWIVVDNGSTDGTREVARGLSGTYDWIRVVYTDGESTAVRGAPVIRAFNAGLAELGQLPDVVVKLDADISFDHDHFERLLAEFTADPKLGIASGSCWELEDGAWRQHFTTRTSARGAARAYRRECLEAVSPLEESMGWDGIDELKANVLGWRTGTIQDLPFRHHRRVGERDGASRIAWATEGRLSHYMGYRFGYLLVRALYRARRNPAALAMVWGYAEAAIRRSPRVADADARAYLREHQRLRNLRLRIGEALGRNA
jgi:poly-beta-1,6-N-acetyl-D-glucosamine synthase